MKALLILGIVVLALALLSLIRIGVRASCGQEGPAVRLLVGPVGVALYPRPEKKKKPPKAEREKPEAQPGEKKLPPPERLLPLVRELLPVALDAAGQLRRKIRIDTFFLDVTVASADPARAAVDYGRLNGAVGMFWPLVEQNFNVKEWRIRTWVDFQREHTEAALQAAVTMTVGQILSLGIRVAVKALPILFNHKNGNRSRQQTQKEAV